MTPTRRLIVLALGGLLLAAGCNAPEAGSAGGTGDLTPAPIPTEPPSAPPPPGLADGSVDLGALADAHAAAVDDRTYRFEVVVNLTVRGGPGTAPGGSGDVRARAESRRVLRVRNGSLRSVSGWWKKDWPGRRDPRTDPREYVGVAGERIEPGPTSGGRGTLGPASGGVLDLWTRAIGQYLAASDVTVVAVGGRTAPRRYHVVATGNPYGLGDPYGGWDARNYTARAVVEPSGLVRALHAEYRVPVRDGVVRVTVDIGYAPADERARTTGA